MKRLESAAIGGDAAEVSKLVGAEIDVLLSCRNQVPGSALSNHGTHGHGEASSSGKLCVYEENAAQLKFGHAGHAVDEYLASEAVELMWHLFDYSPTEATATREPIRWRTRCTRISSRCARHIRHLPMAQ